MNTGEREQLPSSDELELFAYLDGELDDAAMDRFEARLAAEPELAAKLRAHQAIAGFMSDDAERVYGAARVDAIADDVMAAIERDARPKAPVIEIAAAQQTRFASKRRDAQAKSMVWVVFGGAAAVAAAFALFFGAHRDPATRGAPVAVATSAATTASPADTLASNQHVIPTASRAVDPPLPQPIAPGVEVEDLEVGEGATVIYTGSAQGAVVWVNER